MGVRGDLHPRNTTRENSSQIKYMIMVSHPGRGGGSLRYQMATHCQTAALSGSSKRQNLGAVNSSEGKEGVVNFKPRGGGTWSGKGYQLRSDRCGAVAVVARDG